MFPEPLWAVLRFVQWEDTISFHARLFRCFLLGFLDAHSELAVLSQGSERILAVLGQRLADIGFVRDAGHLHEPVSHRASPLGRYNDATMRCPPRRRYEVASLLSFAVNSPTDPTAPVPPLFVFSQSINITHGLHDEPTPPAVAFDPPGSGWVPGGYDGPPTGVVCFILLWLLTLAMIISRRSSMGSGSTRAMCRPPRVAAEPTTNTGERVIRPLPQDHLPMDEVIQSIVAGTPEDVGQQVCMPGAWIYDRQEQGMLKTLERSVFDTMLWTPFYSCVQMGGKVWAHFPGSTSILVALNPWNGGSNDAIIIRQKSEDGCPPMCQGLGADVIPAALNGNEQQGAAQGHLPFESGPSIEYPRGSTTTMLNRRFGASTIADVAIKDPDPARTTPLDVVYGDEIGLTFASVASSNADRLLFQGDISSDVDESASDDGSDDPEDERLFGLGTQRADASALKRKDGCCVLSRRQDGALSDTGFPPTLRRARSSGYLRKKRDMSDDDDEGTGDDSYWTEQVNARLSGERDFRRALRRYGWSDASAWPQDGQEDETDNWRARSSQFTHFAASEKTSDATQCQADGGKLRRYSSPPLNVDGSLSHRAGSGDGPQGIYVVPQKRGRCWSPASSPRSSDRPSGLGFFPFRKTPALLTPEAWRPGCLYIPDPPEDEARQADAWWDGLSSVGSCGSASGAGHRCGTGTVIHDPAEQGLPLSRDALDVPVSWRDRYENDPASRRFISAHRRAMTEG